MKKKSRLFLQHPSHLHAAPLVDEQRLVAVVEPGHVLEPAQERRRGRLVQEEAAEEHQRDDHGPHDGEREAGGGGADAGGEVAEGRGAPAHLKIKM